MGFNLANIRTTFALLLSSFMLPQPAARASGTGFSLRPVAEPAAVIEKRGPAPSPLLDEGIDARRRAVVSGAGQDLRRKPRSPVLDFFGEHRCPVHAGRLELLGAHVVPERGLA